MNNSNKKFYLPTIEWNTSSIILSLQEIIAGKKFIFLMTNYSILNNNIYV